MANSILRIPTLAFNNQGRGAGGPIGGLVTLQCSNIQSIATTAVGNYTFGFRVPANCDGGKIYRLGFHVMKIGQTLTEDWSDGTGDLKITTFKVDKWAVSGGALTTITSKGDWYSTDTVPSNVVSLASMTAALGATPNAADGFAYYEVNRENAPSLFSLSNVNAGDLLRLWVQLTNGTGGTINPVVTSFIEIAQTAA